MRITKEESAILALAIEKAVYHIPTDEQTREERFETIEALEHFKSRLTNYSHDKRRVLKKDVPELVQLLSNFINQQIKKQKK